MIVVFLAGIAGLLTVAHMIRPGLRLLEIAVLLVALDCVLLSGRVG